MSIHSNENGHRGYSARHVAFMGLLFALAMVLSFVESTLPALPMLPIGVKLGLSNIVTMYCLFFLGTKPAFTLAILKSLFVLLTRGPIGAMMSLAGGLCSVTVMLLLLKLKKLDASYAVLSIAGAVFHNVGQLVMSYFLINSSFVYYYLPVMVISGIIMGLATGVVLKVILPYMKKLDVILK